MKNTIILTVLTTLLYGCTSKEGKKIQEEACLKNQQRIERKQIISDLVAKYNISYCWDTLEYELTIEYKPVLDSHQQLIEDIEINDIYIKDSIEYVSLMVGSYSSFHLDLSITKEQEKKLLNPHISPILVVDVNELKKIKLEITGDAYTGIKYESSSDFIGKGKIIEIVSPK